MNKVNPLSPPKPVVTNLWSLLSFASCAACQSHLGKSRCANRDWGWAIGQHLRFSGCPMLILFPLPRSLLTNRKRPMLFLRSSALILSFLSPIPMEKGCKKPNMKIGIKGILEDSFDHWNGFTSPRDCYVCTLGLESGGGEKVEGSTWNLAQGETNSFWSPTFEKIFESH